MLSNKLWHQASILTVASFFDELDFSVFSLASVSASHNLSSSNLATGKCESPLRYGDLSVEGRSGCKVAGMDALAVLQVSLPRYAL